MGYMFGFFLVAAIIASIYAVMMTMPAHQIASMLRMAVPALVTAVGAIFTIIGRPSIGMPLALLGIGWIAANRSVSRTGGFGRSGKSTVRSACFEMELDHESGELDGVVLTGRHDGKRLSRLSPEEVLAMRDELSGDAESAQLLEAYLDRRIPGWREHAQADPGAGVGGAARPGPMTKEEAYQILGLAAGAGAQEVREAHRRLMKRVHPDSGGSTFLAAKINEAKDVLLD
jgi:hypothetical protein